MTLAQLMACIEVEASDQAAAPSPAAPMSEAEQMLAGPVGTIDDLRTMQRQEQRRRGVKIG